MNKKVISLAAALSVCSFVFSQDNNNTYGALTKATEFAKQDAELITKGYLTPFARAFGSSLNSGWYNTAKVHSIGRPDITISINTVFVPTSDQTYDLAGLQALQPNNGATTAPSVMGAATPGPDLYLKASPSTKVLTAPQGLGVSFLPMPTAQLGIGLPLNTDLIVRFVPSIGLGDAGSVGLWGIGIKHSIKQWIPGINDLPFDLSALFGYTNFNLNASVDAANNPDQKFQMNTSAYTFAVLISKKISILTVYGGLGFDGSSTNVKMLGTYNVQSGPAGGPYVTKSIKDPVDVTLDGANSPKITAGFRLKLAILTLHADYTLSSYSVVSAGLGLSLGN